MTSGWRLYWAIFWRTFSYGAAAVFASDEIYKRFNENVSLGTDVVIAGLVMAVVAGVVAVLHAAGASPAATPLGKALRQAYQVAAGVLITVVITVPSDIFNLGPILVPGAIAVAGAFLLTLFANQGAPPVIVPTPETPTPPVLTDAIVGIRAVRAQPTTKAA